MREAVADRTIVGYTAAIIRSVTGIGAARRPRTRNPDRSATSAAYDLRGTCTCSVQGARICHAMGDWY